MAYKFKVGEIITGIEGCNKYSITNERGEYRILSIEKLDSYDRLKIKVVKYWEEYWEDWFVGDIYWVRSIYFRPVKLTQQDEMERLGYEV